MEALILSIERKLHSPSSFNEKKYERYKKYEMSVREVIQSRKIIRVAIVGVVAKIIQRESSKKRTFYDVHIGDKTAEVVVRVFEIHEWPNVTKGAVFLILGRWNPEYKSITPEKMIAAADMCKEFLPGADPEPLEKKLTYLIKQVENPHLHKLLRGVFEGDILEKFLTSPAAYYHHQPYRGGLAEHTIQIAWMMARIAPDYGVCTI